MILHHAYMGKSACAPTILEPKSTTAPWKCPGLTREPSMILHHAYVGRSPGHFTIAGKIEDTLLSLGEVFSHRLFMWKQAVSELVWGLPWARPWPALGLLPGQVRTHLGWIKCVCGECSPRPPLRMEVLVLVVDVACPWLWS